MRHIVALLLVVVVGLAGCGKSDTSSTETKAESGAPPVSLAGTVNNHGTRSLSGTTLALEQDDFYFEPTFIKAKAGDTITVTLKNEGKAEHNFSIDSLKLDQHVEAGETKTVQVTVPATDTLAYYCKYHRGRGMQGAFVVTGASPGAGTSPPETTTSTTSTTVGGSSGSPY